MKTETIKFARNFGMSLLSLALFAGCAGDFRSQATALAQNESNEQSHVAPTVDKNRNVVTTTTSTTTSTTMPPRSPEKEATEKPVQESSSAQPVVSPGAPTAPSVAAPSTAAPQPAPTPEPEPKVAMNEDHLLNGMDIKDFEYEGRIKPTVYYKPIYDMDEANTCTEDKKVNLRGTDKEVLIQLCPNMKKECLMQGSCLFREDDSLRSFNYVRFVQKMPLFAEIDTSVCPYGLGLSNICLDPFYSVAADKSMMKKGDVIFVPALVGMRLPNGQKHNGYLVVRDSGGAIKGHGRFDFFSGYIHWRDDSNPFTQAGLISKTTRKDWFLVKGESAAVILKRRNFPRLPRAVRDASPTNTTTTTTTSTTTTSTTTTTTLPAAP